MKIELRNHGEAESSTEISARGPPSICCQLVISLKSNTWQHIGASESILTFCRKSAHFGTFQHSQKISISRFLKF